MVSVMLRSPPLTPPQLQLQRDRWVLRPARGDGRTYCSSADVTMRDL